jgi:hypothetical protein
MFVGAPAILLIMFRMRPPIRVLLILLCLGIIMMRVGGAHLHYCFDGTEPPVSLHIDTQAGGHHKDGSVGSAQHEDVDISVGGDALIKKAPNLLDLLGLLIVLTFALLLPRLRSIACAFDSLVPVSAPRAYLRPPLRGPPL